MTQNQALKILHSGDNVFITGSAGTGKTFLLNQFIQDLKKEEVNVAVTASTGIAATHLGGRTIHSWAGIGIADKMSDKEIKKMLKKRDNRQRIRSTKVLVIDEISMLDATRLDLVDQVCRLVKDPFLPFGGIQTVLCGDFFQLPPVSNSKVDNLFAYQAEVWSKADIQVCYLQERFRQQDAHFLELLDTIRANQAGENEVALLRNYRKHSVDGQESEGTYLFTHNIDVDAINNLHLRQIKGKEKEYHMTAHGPKDLVRFLKKSCLAPEHLVLKVGARVMFVRNNFEQNYVNGTLGQVISFEDDQPLIKTNAGDLWLTVPVESKGHFSKKICDIKIIKNGWNKKHLKSIEFAYKKSTYYEQYINEIDRIINGNYDFLTDMNMDILRFML